MSKDTAFKQEAPLYRPEIYAGVDEHRKSFYEKLAKNLPPDFLAYYVGSGNDPIPLRYLGKKVIYSSLNDADYFKSETFKGTQLDTTYAKATQAPFPENTFDAIIMNDSLIQATKDLGDEFKRLLKPDGIIILENTTPERLEKYASLLKLLGFVPDANLDMHGGKTHVKYYTFRPGQPNNKSLKMSHDEYITSDPRFARESTFQIRVFKKTDKVMIEIGE